VVAGLAAVVKDRGILTAGILEGVPEDGHVLETAVVVDRMGKPDGRTIIPHQPDRLDQGQRVVRVAKNVPE
jgi:hypothetical protein